MRRRVVMTGIGLLTPLGLDRESSWQALLAGKSGVGPITKFDASNHSCRIAGELRGFDPLTAMEKKEARKMDPFTHYAVAAAREALADSGYDISPANAERTGVYIGSGIGGLQLLESQHAILTERGPRRVSPFFIPGMILNMATGQVSILFGAKGPSLACATACATGSHAIGESTRLIRDGYADAMIAGGAEAVITPLAVAGFCSMKALSTRNDEPEKASRPFDSGRDGFVMGEGAGILMLEERDSALARGARVYAEVAGYGLSGDAFHISAPSEDGDGPIRAMRGALADGGIEPGEIDYINAHGTSTPAGDRIEVMAVRKVFGGHASEVVCSSTKSMTGHLLGAAGGVETAIVALAIRDNRVPPTINHDDPDPECEIDCAPNEAPPDPSREGGAHRGVGDRASGQGQTRLGGGHQGAGPALAGLGFVELGLGGDVAVAQVAQPGGVAFAHREGFAGLEEQGALVVELELVALAVDLEEHVAGIDGIAFLDQGRGNAAVDLGGEGGLVEGDELAGGLDTFDQGVGAHRLDLDRGGLGVHRRFFATGTQNADCAEQTQPEPGTRGPPDPRSGGTAVARPARVQGQAGATIRTTRMAEATIHGAGVLSRKRQSEREISVTLLQVENNVIQA